MAYHEGIKISGLHSYYDFGLNINSRKIDLPPKNSIRKTVPFMNGYHDFSMINGAISWGARTIAYTFDIVGATVEEMDAKRTEVVNWLCNQHDVDIYDDTIPDYHFHGSYDTNSQSEDGEKSELTVNFVCYPFMIENEARVVYTNGADATFVVNNIGQAVRPIIETAQSCSVKIRDAIQSVIDGETRLSLVLPTGETEVQIIKDNEIEYPYSETTHTENGITFMVNDDGTIVADGTATGIAWFYVQGSGKRFLPPVGYHLLSGSPAGGAEGGYRMLASIVDEDGTIAYSYDNGDGAVFEIKDSTAYITIAIRVLEGYTVNNLVFSPALYGETKLKWHMEVL